VRRLLLGLFPAAWRRRYGDELRALLDETGLGPGDALDLARTGIRLRITAIARGVMNGGFEMVIGPAWRHPTAWAVVGALMVTPTLVFLLLSALAYELGISSLASLMEPINEVLQGARPLDLLLVGAPVFALVTAMAPLLRLELRGGSDGGREAVLGLRLRAVNLVVVGVAVMVGGFLLSHIVVESVLQLGA
jgi:hypothetical protein